MSTGAAVTPQAHQGELWGVMARFAGEEELLHAARAAFDAGYRKMDAYTPGVVKGLAEAIGFERTRVPLITLLGGLAGGGFTLWLAWWISAVDYPLNVGGRALDSFPAFIVPTFEATILVAALAAFFAVLVLNGLPRPHHPVFGAPGFERASRDRFFLCIEATDPHFDADRVRRFLEELGPEEVVDVVT